MSAKDYAIKLLSVCDRSEKEIREKLLRKGFDENDSNEAIDFCREYGYINDDRFAEHFVHDAVILKKWGASKIKAELKRRGVNEESYQPLLEGRDEHELLLSEFKKRFKDADVSDKKIRNRIYGYFARRGFKTSDIFRVMGEERDDCEYFE